MANKWLPPLLCPIPRGHANHYATQTMTSLQMLLRRSKHIRSLYSTESGLQWASLEGMKSTYNRLFVRRKKPITKTQRLLAKIRCGPKGYNYAIIDPMGKVVQEYKTLSLARKDLKKDSLKVKRHGRWLHHELDYGSSIIHLQEEWHAPDAAKEELPIESKKCAVCPNKTSHQGQCHCQFWAAIRDGVQKHRWLTPHEVKMELKRREKDSIIRGNQIRQSLIILRRK